MNQKINIVDLGRIDYQTAWDFQKEFHKKVQIGKEIDTLFLLEHDPVYTLGKNANKNNLLEQPESEVKVFNVERGGDITYHGPGQLVGYPILDLHHYQKNISWFMRTLEEILIETLSTFGIKANQRDGLTGVWVGDEKIGAQGVRISRWVTMHGFSLNVNTDLTYFDSIVPCGITNCGITSMKKIIGDSQDMDLVKKRIVNAFHNTLISSANKMEAV